MAAPPRVFKLLEDHEGAMHGDLPPYTSLGLVDPKTQTFTDWNASIDGKYGNFENRLLELKITAGESYPAEPPLVRFIHKVNLPGVDNSGMLNVSSIQALNPWDPVNHSIKSILQALSTLVSESRMIEQPAEGSKY